MAQQGMEVLDQAECERLLASSHVGRVAFVSAGEVVMLPINYRFHAGHVVFRTSAGEKLGAAIMQSPVAFEIDGWNPEGRRGWSVLVRGEARLVDASDRVDELDALGLEPWAAEDRDTWVEVVPKEMSGRRLPSEPDED